MTKNDLADFVAHARAALRAPDGATAAHEIAENVREGLKPLRAAADELSLDARKKLEQVESRLDSLAGRHLTSEDRETLDMLMLGLWIRVDGAFGPGDE